MLVFSGPGQLIVSTLPRCKCPKYFQFAVADFSVQFFKNGRKGRRLMILEGFSHLFSLPCVIKITGVERFPQFNRLGEMILARLAET